MVVVVIIGILAATIIPQFIGTTQDAKVSAAKAQVAELESAVEDFTSTWTAIRPPKKGWRRWWTRRRATTPRNGAGLTSSSFATIHGAIRINTCSRHASSDEL